MKGGFILFNGKFYRDSDPLFTGADFFRLNGGVRESFRAENNLVTFARDNFDFLLNSLEAIDLPVPAEWNFPRFSRDVSRLLNKNHHYLAARVIIHLIQGNPGTEYLMSSEEITSGFYPLKENGILIDFYEDGTKGSSSFSPFEPSSRSLWGSATRALSSLSRQNLILLNTHGFACESIGGSFGYLTSKTAVFPSLESRGYAPSIMQVVKSCTEELGYLIQEKKEIKREELLNADELFLIDNCLGIEPVLGLYARRYYTTGSLAIAAKLRERAREQHLSTQISDKEIF